MRKIVGIPLSLKEGLRCAWSSRPVLPGPSLRQHAPKVFQFSTTTRLRAGIAAPEIKFRQGRQASEERQEEIFYARVVPESRSYFTAQPSFIDDLLQLQDLARRYDGLPTLKPGEAPRVAWMAFREYKSSIGETVKTSKYQRIVEILHRLNHIHPSVMPPEVTEVLNQYKRNINPYQNVTKTPHVDERGKALGAGRRKAATARAYLVEGTGEVLVNGKTLSEAFGRIHDRESVIWALKATDRIDKYNVWALAEGGGTTGQAEALTLAVGKALLAHEPALKPALRRGKISSIWDYDRLLTCRQRAVSHGIREEWKERSQEESRQERCLPGSRDSFSLYVYYVIYRKLLQDVNSSFRWSFRPFSNYLFKITSTP